MDKPIYYLLGKLPSEKPFNKKDVPHIGVIKVSERGIDRLCGDFNPMKDKFNNLGEGTLDFDAGSSIRISEEEAYSILHTYFPQEEVDPTLHDCSH